VWQVDTSIDESSLAGSIDSIVRPNRTTVTSHQEGSIAGAAALATAVLLVRASHLAGTRIVPSCVYDLRDDAAKGSIDVASGTAG
jgi:myosin-crossreactive antigen